MHKLHRWLLLTLVLLGATAGWAPAQAATSLGRDVISSGAQQWNAAAFSLTPEASSPPEYGRCIKTTGGLYRDGGCTETGSSSEKNFEWYAAFGSAHPLEKANFSNVLKEATVANLETVSGASVTCEGQSSAGKYTGNKTIGGVVVTFTGCSAFGGKCQTSGSAAGTIVTKTLEGVLGVEELAAEAVNYKIGLALFPIGHTGQIASFTCASMNVSIAGSLISKVASNSMKLTTQIKSKATEGKQKPEGFVGESPEVLMSTMGEAAPEQAGETLITIQTNEERIEINSVV
jgi:hypothetical protein